MKCWHGFPLCCVCQRDSFRLQERAARNQSSTAAAAVFYRRTISAERQLTNSWENGGFQPDSTVDNSQQSAERKLEKREDKWLDNDSVHYDEALDYRTLPNNSTNAQYSGTTLQTDTLANSTRTTLHQIEDQDEREEDEKEGDEREKEERAAHEETNQQQIHQHYLQSPAVRIPSSDNVIYHCTRCCHCNCRPVPRDSSQGARQHDSISQAVERSTNDSKQLTERSSKRNSIGNLKQKLGRVTVKLGAAVKEKPTGQIEQSRPRSQSVFDFRRAAAVSHARGKGATPSRERPESGPEGGISDFEQQRRIKRHSFNFDAPLVERWSLLENMANSFDTVSTNRSLTALATDRTGSDESENNNNDGHVACDKPVSTADGYNQNMREKETGDNCTSSQYNDQEANEEN